MSVNEQNSINEINFTKRCILMSVISKEKDLILINSFNKIPIVKLYTADSSYENFIYSKIKGAFCLLMTKEKNNSKYFFRIYSLKDYSTLFNMEIKKENMQYITQYRDDFYFMELRSSFLGFKFLSKDSARLFFLLLNEDPKKEVLEQNEGAKNIKPKDISKTLIKVKDYIKARLKYKFENFGNNNTIKTVYNNKRKEINANSSSSSQKKENFNFLYINDIKGEYLDTSVLPEMQILLNNLEIDDTDSSCYLFTEKKLNLEKCQEIVNNYQINSENNGRYRRRSEKMIPITIIDKDCHTISNTDLYAEIMAKNMINNIRTQKRLDIFQKEHKKRHRASKIGALKKGSRKTKGRLTKTSGSRFSNISKINDRSSSSNYYSENNNHVNIYMDILDANKNNSSSKKKKINAKSVDKENTGKFAKDKRQINSMTTTEVFKELDEEDEGDFELVGLNYFDDEKDDNKNNKNGNIIEEKPEDEEKDKVKEAKNIKSINKRVISGKKEGFSMRNFLMSNNKK